MVPLYCFVTHQARLSQTVDRVKAMLSALRCEQYVIACGGFALDRYLAEQHILELKCGDAYEDLPEKLLCMFRYLTSTASAMQGWTHLVKLDEDMIIHRLLPAEMRCDFDLGGDISNPPERMLRSYHIGKCSAESPWNTTQYKGPFCRRPSGGRGYIISRNAAGKICTDENIVQAPRQHIYEDVMVALLLLRHNIQPVHLILRPYITSPEHL